MMFTIWNELEHYHDGTSRMQCKGCKNTMRLSRHTVYGFKFCPNCGLPAEIKAGVSGKETAKNAIAEII